MLVIILSAGPLSVFPAIMGLMAVMWASVFCIASWILGMASMGAMLRMGLLGHMIICSAWSNAWMMWGAGWAFSAFS